MGSTGPPLLLSSGRSFGGKCSEYVLHFGSLINQQLFPAVQHMHDRAVHGGSEDEFYVLAPSSLESPLAFPFVLLRVDIFPCEFREERGMFSQVLGEFFKFAGGV